MPRAAVTTDEMAKEAKFSYFGTNDLPQMGGGFSRDDSDASLKRCVGLGIYEEDPFQVLDQSSGGELVPWPS